MIKEASASIIFWHHVWITLESENMVEPEKIRNRRSYKTFQELKAFLDKKPSKAKVLTKFHEMLDASNGYGSEKNANYARESLDLFIRDMEE